jgi:hypothetical protein
MIPAFTDGDTENVMSEYERSAASGDTIKAKKSIKLEVDIASYRPCVKERIWYVSETDVEWMSTGCYILGTGGGGSPYSHSIRLREILHSGGTVRVISPDDLKDDDLVGGGGGAGSPTVGIEKLQADELVDLNI